MKTYWIAQGTLLNCSVMTWVGRESKRDGMMADSFCCTVETNTVL